ncbi:phage tail sheath protein [Andreesenia angusta]|uniref:Phage tail sheath protein n=1 Tax=Andreesenia angusta TaxID=39480 RepID=A0A1S1V6X4_9FIRM|nr:phage tail sheath subtilisin-like domain-containing protein [Andreesenia angusta]OHW62170.1 phage tail sheath protein [Andreesenia angusta]
MPTIGMPQVQINFASKGLTLIQRSARGIVLMILKDSTNASKRTFEYSSLIDVNSSDFTAKNYEYISQVMMGAPYKLIVETMDPTTGTLQDLVTRITNKKYNYICYPGGASIDNAALVSFIKSERNVKQKTVKLVTNQQVADDRGVISFDMTRVTVGDIDYTGQEYTGRIAGILAGLSLERSATFYVLPEVTSISEYSDPDAAINAGSLILVNDGEKIKIARAVNTLTTYTANIGEDFSKIKIIEGMDMIKDDIRDTFFDYYVGKIINSYENKQLFLANINGIYFKELEGNVLENSYNNYVDIDLEEQRKYCISKGENVIDMTEQAIKMYPSGSKVFVSGKIKLVDAMEDLFLNVAI